MIWTWIICQSASFIEVRCPIKRMDEGRGIRAMGRGGVMGTAARGGTRESPSLVEGGSQDTPDEYLPQKGNGMNCGADWRRRRPGWNWKRRRMGPTCISSPAYTHSLWWWCERGTPAFSRTPLGAMGLADSGMMLGSIAFLNAGRSIAVGTGTLSAGASGCRSVLWGGCGLGSFGEMADIQSVVQNIMATSGQGSDLSCHFHIEVSYSVTFSQVQRWRRFQISKTRVFDEQKKHR